MKPRIKIKVFSTKASRNIYPKTTEVMEKISIFEKKPQEMTLFPITTLSRGVRESYVGKTIC